MELNEGRITANGIDFAYLETGASDGPLALCLHGFPDTAWTWRHLLPRLADAGYRAVAPFLRGYAPTALAPDDCYHGAALVADACALHEALGGDGDAVLVGHDWGALTAYGAAAHHPHRWRRVVTAAVPPLAAAAELVFTYPQLKRSFYIWLFQLPMAEGVVAADDLAFLDGLWADWTTDYDCTEDLARVKEALRKPEHLRAAIGYYRAQFGEGDAGPDLAAEQAALFSPPPQPTLYLHGRADAAFGIELVRKATDYLPAPGSEMVVVEGANHFLHLERPDEVGERVIRFLTS